MTRGAAPARGTHALIVAVSEYGYGNAEWNRGALDQDALLFHGWLRERGVPQDNILLLDGASATAERVREALAEDVPRRRGEELWVYWAGHGLDDSRGELRLLLAGSPAHDKRNLRLTDLLRLYRSDALDGFARQTFIVDACRLSAAEQAVTGLSGPLDLITPGAERACEQYVWLATQRNAPAAYRPGRGGLFSAAVRSSLAQAEGLEWKPTIEELTALVEEERRSRSEKDPLEVQLPSRLSFLLGGDVVAEQDVGTLTRPHPALPRPTGLLDAHRHRMLGGLLECHPCWQSPAALIEAMWPVADWVGELSLSETLEPLTVVERLDAALVPQRRLPPLLVFLEHLAGRCQDGRGDTLREFTEELAQPLGLRSALLGERERAAGRGHRDTVLLIKVEADPAAGDSYRVAAYVYRRGATLLVRHEDTREVGAADVPVRCEELILRMSPLLAGLTEDLITYEFLLDHHHLNAGVEHWGIAPGLSGTDRIGWQSPVLVRSLDRIKDLRIHRVVPQWERRWKAFERGPERAEGVVGVIYENEDAAGHPAPRGLRTFLGDSAGLRQELTAARDLACVLLGFPYGVARDETRGGLLESLLMSGIPVALWWRRDEGTPPQQELLHSIAGGDLRELPLRLLALRQSGHAGDVTLLWDPPDPFPLRTSLLKSPPPLRERITRP